MERFLLLWLEGSLQAWGCDSRFDVRNTLDFPSRSGLSGLLLGAAGASGPQTQLLETLSNSPLTVFSFESDTSELIDFHMVGNGYDDSSKWEKLMSPKKSDGSTPVGGGAKLTYRHYLVDRCFAAIWKMPGELALQFSQALQAPVFETYLGRKCCIPSEFIFQGCFSELEQAKEQLQALACRKSLSPAYCYREVSDSECDEETLLLADVPLRFGLHKLYGERFVKKESFSF